MIIEYNTLEERKLALEAEIELDPAIADIYSDTLSQYGSLGYECECEYTFDDCFPCLKDRVKKESSSDEMYEDFVKFYNEIMTPFQKKLSDRRKEEIANRPKRYPKQSTCQDSPYQTQKERHEEQRGFDNDAYCNDDEPKKFSLSDYDEY
jgi:hypothetical protein